MKKDLLSKNIKIAVLGAISFLIMYIEFPIPPFPPFMKLDFSDLPAIIGGFSMGPLAGILIELVKNLIHLLKTSTSGIGELANFLVGIAYVLPAALIYKYKKTKKWAVISMIIGIFSMIVLASIANYYILIPFYSKFMPIEQIIDISKKVSNNIVDLYTYIVYVVVPFNAIKGMLLSLITFIIYKKIDKILK